MCGNTARSCAAAGPAGKARTPLPRPPRGGPGSPQDNKVGPAAPPQPRDPPPGAPPGAPPRPARGGAGARLDEHTLRDGQESAIEIEELARESLAGAELRHPAPALGPNVGVRKRHRHQIFSTLTRNALNSGVRAFASPTNGVSALASQ